MTEEEPPPDEWVRPIHRYINTSLNAFYWFVLDNEDFPTSKRSFLERLANLKEGYKRPNESNLDYLQRMAEDGHVVQNNGHLCLVNANVGLRFNVDDWMTINISNDREYIIHHELRLSFAGWEPANSISLENMCISPRGIEIYKIRNVQKC